MSDSSNPFRDSEFKAIWDKAMTSSRGLRLDFPTIRAAERCRFGLYRARNQERKLNATISGEHRSDWDIFRVSVERAPDGWSVILSPYSEGNIGAIRIIEL